jgi:hypothetical protein
MRYLRTAIAVAALCLVAGSPAQAARKDGGIADASKRLAGFTAGELLGEELRQVLELPLEVNPAAGADTCLFAGHKKKVLLLWTRRDPPVPECDVKPGTPVFFYGLGGECSTVEEPPFFGETEEEQRQCMLDFLASTLFHAIEVRIDGGPPVNIGLERYLAVSEQGTVFLPQPNVLDVRGNRQTTFVAAGYVALVRPLPPGSHTITVTIVGSQFAGTNQAVVNVVPGLKS